MKLNSQLAKCWGMKLKKKLLIKKIKKNLSQLSELAKPVSWVMRPI